MKPIICLLISLPYLTFSQERGIKFEEGTSWNQVKQKAKSENKYIFVDAYATWCGPCKMMDRDVYPQENVGDFFNSHFVSVKVQMDSSAQDNEYIKSWYADADAIKKQYPIEALPSFLFFSPDGKLVHRDLGFKKPDELIELAKTAVDPEKQTYTIYYNLLDGYKAGTLSPEQKLKLATMARTLKEKETAETVAKNYKESYLDKLSWNELTKEQLDFIGNFHPLITAEGSKGRYFDMFHKHAAELDKKVGHENFSNWFVREVVTKEEIEDKLWKDGKPVTQRPDWNRIKKTIVKKYGPQYGDFAGFVTQMDFYKRTKNGKEYAKAMDALMKQYPPVAGGKKLSKAIGGLAGFGDDAWGLNVVAWDVFEFSDDKTTLERALAWADLAIKLDRQEPTKPKSEGESLENVNLQIVDTKANILYKLGRVEEAIALEQEAVDLDERRHAQSGRKDYVSDMRKVVEQMKESKPTWLAESN